MNVKVMSALFATALLAGCATYLNDPMDDGFTWFDGTLPTEAPSEYYIVRYEQQGGLYGPEAGSRCGSRQWKFVEVRQLKDSVTVLTDGEAKPQNRRIAGKNWLRWVPQRSRNVRVRYVGADYSVEKENRAPAPEGFVELFNGKDFTNWKGVTREEDFHKPDVRRAAWPEKLWEMQAKADKLMKEHWHVRDGALYFDGKAGGYSLASAKDYGNFELVADWRLLKVTGDSGFYLRGVPQVQIWDPNNWDGIGSGGIWNNARAMSNPTTCEDRPIGEWNRCRMRMVGEKVSVWLNGVKVVDDVIYEDVNHPGKPLPLIQQIELQCHGDPIEFRNIFVKELPEAADDIPDPAKAVRGERIDLLKDGLAGWEAVDPQARMGWSVKDGVLVNETGIAPEKTSRGGAGTTNLKTKRADFYDFDLSYDVLVPKKCNSGVYLRGRYEIQVVDSYGRKPDCHNMAALYDLITPSVAAEKPAGEWQHVDVTLYRRHLTVVLNGVKIIDNKAVGGVTPAALDGNEFAAGPIMLQGDHSNASFRNMILMPIVR